MYVYAMRQVGTPFECVCIMYHSPFSSETKHIEELSMKKDLKRKYAGSAKSNVCLGICLYLYAYSN